MSTTSNKKESIHPDVTYLKDDQIGKVICKGLSVLVKERPKNPIDYLAKWLLSHAQKNLRKKNFEISEKKREDLKSKFLEELKVLEEKETEKTKELAKVEDIKNRFKMEVQKTEDLVDIFDNLAGFLQEFTKSTGVYIGKLEQLKKDIGEGDDEKGHLDEALPWVIKYWSATNDHKYLVEQTLPVGQGVTHDVFKEKADSPEENPPAEEGAEGEEGEESREVQDELSCVFIPEVVREPGMKYFRVPKLGSYFAVPLVYESCLFEESLDSALENYKVYVEKKGKQEEKRRELQEEIEKEREEYEEAGKEEEGEEEDPEQPPRAPFEPRDIEEELEKVDEEPYQVKNISFVVCVDTMGQDRELTEEERGFIKETVISFKSQWEETERNSLTKDKLKRYEDFRNEETLLEKTLPALQEAEDKYIEDELSTMELSEEQKEIETDVLRLRCSAKELARGEFTAPILALADYKVIKMQRIFQSLFYLLGYTREAICERDTNKLFWKKAKNLWNKELLKKLEAYEPWGPREGVPPRYRLINWIQHNLEGIVEQDVQDYNIALSMVFRWLKKALDLRVGDIRRRLEKRERLREEKALKEQEEKGRLERQEEELAEALRLAKEKFDEEQKAKEEAAVAEEGAPPPTEPVEPPKEFNEEEFKEAWLKEFEEANPPIEIPPEVVEEKDDDYEGEVEA